jgi:50S ribosomal protein L16 3-hydroxylase
MTQDGNDPLSMTKGSPLGDIPLDVFLRDYWQKKPCLVRQAFPDFRPVLDENDVAGLACEELAESRLVTGNHEQANWQLEQGPFTEERLSRLPETDWCLLVQDVEKHYPPLQSLLEHFDFLPSWRMDDLMVSISAPGGSVGPHVDQYDVFLLQASGQRRWQVNEIFKPDLLSGSELRVLKEFTPGEEWLLYPGDMLYLPPGVAHFGLATTLGMTWSIGLRAPSQADLFQAYGEWLAEHKNEGRRFTDPPFTKPRQAGEVSTTELTRLARLMKTGSQGGDGHLGLDAFLGSFLSRYRLAHQPAAPGKQVDLPELEKALNKGARLQRNPWTRLNWILHEGQALLFAAGDSFPCSGKFAPVLCGPELPGTGWQDLDLDDAHTVVELINTGHLWLEKP